MTAKQSWIDVYFSAYKWYRRIKGGIWYQHEFTDDAAQIFLTPGKRWWARYGNINRYSNVVKTESH